MKKLATLCLSLFACFGAAHAQTVLYSQTFDSTYADWSLNTSDLGGVTTMTPNYWIVNSVYTGSAIAPTVTPNEPSGIYGNPESAYLHIRSAIGPANATFNASGNHSYTASLNTPAPIAMLRCHSGGCVMEMVLLMEGFISVPADLQLHGSRSAP